MTMTNGNGPLADRDDLLRLTLEIAQTLAGILATLDDIAHTLRRLAGRTHLTERSGPERPEDQ
jgi:hypothetical protein